MTFNPDIHHRRSIRLRDYDYSDAGAYFVTICAQNRDWDFGEIIDGEMRLNELGRVVEACWRAIAGNFPTVKLDAWVIMPNHLHGIILITNSITSVGAKQGSPALPAFGRNEYKSEAEKDYQGEAGETCFAPTKPLHGTLPGTKSGSLGAIVQNFKSVSSRKVNKLRQRPGSPVWQRNYYERVIRSENELKRAREYIVNNLMEWGLDKENPANCP